MADEVKGQGARLGEFQLGRRYEEVGPELGRLYEARNVRTGRAALVLRPGKRMKWLLEGGWQVRLSTQRGPSAVTLEVERAPPSGRGTKLTDSFVLFSGALQRVEDNAQVGEHLTGGPMRGTTREMAPAWWPRAWRGLATSGVILLMGFSYWLGGVREARLWEDPARRGVSDASLQTDAAGMAPIAYPLPKKPFPTQKEAPCNPKLDQVEINGGCWATLERRAPCLAEVQAEYQGKCYIPIGKKETPPLQSIDP